MALETYRAKRDFNRTKEPAGSRRKRKSQGWHYLIQKHAARRLHYDLRLELDGVLLSWAVTRGPSLVAGEARLAVQVEDHPLEYGDFEGTIPQGEYGGGTVILWDRGTWTPEGDPHKGLAKGHLDFTITGEKLQGRWHLVRLKRKPGEKRDNWLLLKARDDAAQDDDAPDVLVAQPDSVKTGRALDDVAGEAPGWSSRTGPLPQAKTAAKAKTPPKAKKAGAKAKRRSAAELPAFVEPQLATLVAKSPSGDKWLHEIKFDGYRLQARIAADGVRLLTRSGLDWTDRFGQALPDALASLDLAGSLLDGELVVENAAGASDFSALQADLSAGRGDRFVYYAFDAPFLAGRDLRAVPLVERKQLLQDALAKAKGRIRFSEHFEQDGQAVLDHACRLSLEGLVSKRRDAPYRSGRSRDWVKSKCADRQEFAIGGYVPASTDPHAIGSLVLGVYEDGSLRHVGRVGTGFTMAVAQDLRQRLEPLEQPDSPFAAALSAVERKGVRFVAPELVAEVEFRSWTADRHLRHAAFRGLREDKPAREVVLEHPVDTKNPKPARPSAVTLTHPDRVYWPDQGITKAGLADYYEEVWPRMAPFVVDRPLSLLRCPDGIAQACFFQKHAWAGMNKAIRQVADPRDKAGKKLLAIRDRDGLLALAQSGVLEVHPWGATLARLEKPDMLIFDLDPGPGVAWQQVIEAAQDVRRRLEAMGLAAFVKTSGGKGLHVVVPLQPKADWTRAKAFTKAVAEAMAQDAPERYVATMSKSRRQGRIFIDYLRNGRGSTAVAPYSTRARDGGAVSMPVAWDELGPDLGPAQFTITNAGQRLASQKADPWADFRDKARPLPA
ncbi:DNA ligase D [Zavarzinia sp. CC-PAN008]|uniref:DNA ligase D n=1 Tax=Zavarzinia sp. CC-PAN008 TaxID=3243332 RepID=UPI003F747DA3